MTSITRNNLMTIGLAGALAGACAIATAQPAPRPAPMSVDAAPGSSNVFPAPQPEPFWQPFNFSEAWGMEPIDGETSVALIPPEYAGRLAVAEDCTDWPVGIVFAGARGGPQFDLFGDLTETVIHALPVEDSVWSEDLADLDHLVPDETVAGTVDFELYLIAGRLTTPLGYDRPISGSILLVTTTFTSPENSTVGSIFFTPTRQWQHLDDAVADITLQADTLWNAQGEPLLAGDPTPTDPVSAPDNQNAQPIDPDAIDPSGCLSDYLEDYGNCLGQYADDIQDCLDEHDDRMTTADNNYQTCLDNIGFWDCVEGGAVGAGAGGAAGGGIGACFGGIGAGPGALIGGIGGLIGGCIIGPINDKTECIRNHTNEIRNSTQLLQNCSARAERDRDRCIDDAVDDYLDCLANHVAQ